MSKSWSFEVKGHHVKILNSWFHGAKMYVDGDLKDYDKSLFAFGDEALMSASLGENGVLEINPKSKIFTVELDAFLLKTGSKELVYSSDKPYGLKSV